MENVIIKVTADEKGDFDVYTKGELGEIIVVIADIIFGIGENEKDEILKIEKDIHKVIEEMFRIGYKV